MENGSRGPARWAVSDTEVVTRLADGSYQIVSDFKYRLEGSRSDGEVHLESALDANLTHSNGSGYFADGLGHRIPGSDFHSTGQLGLDGTWNFDLSPFTVQSHGFTPDGGGSGNFTVTFSTPEPASVGLLALGSLGLLAILRRRRS